MHGEANLTLPLKGQCQCRTIILAILVDLLSPMICAKIRPQGWRRFLKVFTIYGHGSHLAHGP